ncbi:PIR Superfamily Protein [Plasmodium ovale wallikeri]|uniref:PIR Superfamily Protein n=1 Tax=Plasmodium ovale wallikeri TaxID=864142 RepID=A0A1A9API4_PLAOA|nr:PIR Superfamily Protein [Plasmodium ovale wallikeri]
MSSSGENFTYDQIIVVYPFLKNINFGKIYEEFKDKVNYDETGTRYCAELKTNFLCDYIEEDIQINFCNILYKIIVKIKGWNNSIFNGIDDDDKMYCFCLKYWLYDHLNMNTLPKGQNIDDLFEKWQKGIKDKIDANLSNPCIFRKLEWEEREKLKSIYAFILLYYMNVKSIPEKDNVDCKYLNYFGEGLKAYYESLNKCSTEKEDDNYCKEFNEFQKIYGLRNIHWETSTLYEKYSYVENSSEHCALKIESHNNPLHLSYWYEKEKIHLSHYPIDSQRSTIISASSALGATAGISVFLLYLFKFTNIRSLFGQGKQQDNTMFLNVDEGNHDFTFPISDSKNTNFGNNQYNITYLSVDNS